MRKPKPSGNKGRTHERLSSTYDRRPGRIPPGRRILIVCEGAKTEPDYFLNLRKQLKLSLVEVEIEKNAGAPIAIVDKAQQIAGKRKREDAFDEVWCVFDCDAKHLNPTFAKAVQKAVGLSYHLAVSNPAFEFWYVLHFEYTARVFGNAEEVKAYLRSHHIPDYEECMPVFDLVCGQTKKAIQHSKKILENHPMKEDRFPNPSTFVHELVEELILMSPSGRAHLLG